MPEYKKILALLKDFFPSPYHHYHLVEKPWGISFETLHWSYYLVSFLLGMVVLYYLLAWEASKWTNPFKVPFSWFFFIISAIVSGVLVCGLLFIFYGHDITKLEVNMEEKCLVVHGVIFKTKIPFSEMESIRLNAVYVQGNKGSSGRSEFYLLAGEERIFCFGSGSWTDYKNPGHQAFSKYAMDLGNALDGIVKLETRKK